MDKIKKVIWSPVTEDSLEDASQQLLLGELIGLPTETVYGLAADAENALGLKKIFQMKGRPAEHPVIVHISSGSDISYWAKDISLSAQVLMKYFWPGPLTLIFRKKKHVLDLITGGQETVGLRCPNHSIAQKLLRRFARIKKHDNVGLAAPSANYFGKVSPTRAVHVFEEFNGEISVLDGGDCSVGIESTIVDVSSECLSILRPGKISEMDIFSVLEREGLLRKWISREKRDEKKSFIYLKSEQSKEQDVFSCCDFRKTSERVSGCFLSHYAPKTPLYLLNLKKPHIFFYFQKLFLLEDPFASIFLLNEHVIQSEYALLLKPMHEFMKQHVLVKRLQSVALVFTDDTYERISSPRNIDSEKVKFKKVIFSHFSLPSEPNRISFHLYDLLRRLDKLGFDQIWFERPEEQLEYLAVDDRLKRAAKGIIE